MTGIWHLFLKESLSLLQTRNILNKLSVLLPNGTDDVAIEFEYCLNVEVLDGVNGGDVASKIPVEDKDKLLWLFRETFEPTLLSTTESFLSTEEKATLGTQIVSMHR